MKRLLITASAFTLLAVPVLAQSSKSNSEAASQAAARASGGFSGGNSFTNNFGGSKIPNNTPDVVVSPGSVSGADCQLPGIALGGAIVGNGGAFSFPGGVDEECKALTLASFYAKLSNSVSDQREARTYRQTSVALTCQVPRMRALPLCAPDNSISRTRRDTSGSPYQGEGDRRAAAEGEGQPAVASGSTLPPSALRPAYSYADLQAQRRYCDNYPAASPCSTWRQVQR